MSKFKIGDKVRSVENAYPYLTRNKAYTVVGINDPGSISVITDKGVKSSFWTERFELLFSKPEINLKNNSISDKVKELEDKKTELEACIKALLEEIETTSNNMSKLVEQIKGKLNE